MYHAETKQYACRVQNLLTLRTTCSPRARYFPQKWDRLFSVIRPAGLRPGRIPRPADHITTKGRVEEERALATVFLGETTLITPTSRLVELSAGNLETHSDVGASILMYLKKYKLKTARGVFTAFASNKHFFIPASIPNTFLLGSNPKEI